MIRNYTQNARWLLILLLSIPLVRCGKDVEGDVGPSAPRVESSERSGFPGRVVIPVDSPQLNQFRIEMARSEIVPEYEVVAPGRIEFDVNRVSRVVLPVSGRVERVLVRLGDYVKAGQPLLTLDSPDADAALSDFKQARSSFDRAKADHERIRDLYEHKAAAKKEAIASEADKTQAEAAFHHARRRLEILGLAEDGEPGQKVIVRAPLSGKVIDMEITAGEYRNDTTTPVLTVADLSTVWVTSAVPENSIRFIETGESVQVELFAYPDEVFTARVRRIADKLDPETRTVQVQAELPNPGGRFKPEMFGRIRHTHNPRTLPVVPTRAILHRGSDTVVYRTPRKGEFELVPVSVGKPKGNVIPVLSGILPGDSVVVEGGMILAGMETL